MKLYQYVKILYVQPNCSMLPSVLGLCAPSFLQDRYADECGVSRGRAAAARRPVRLCPV